MSQTEKNSAQEMEELCKSIAARMRKASEGCSTNPWIRPTICRVPEPLRKLKPSAYTPHVVSIGPLHQNDQRLTAIQDLKFSLMHTLFGRTAESPETCEEDANRKLSECLDAMFKMVPDARNCYGERLEDSDVQLASTLLLDGCFILELLFKFKHESDDSLFKNNLSLSFITRDLLLLENQIPFFVLEKLFPLTLQKQKRYDTLSLTEYIRQLFQHMIIFDSEMTQRGDCDHILGFFHIYYRPGGTPGDFPAVKYSATQLHRTGVKFKESKRKDGRRLRVRFRTSTSTSEEEATGISTWNLFSWLGRCNTRRESTSVEEGTCNSRISTPTSYIWNLFSRLSTLLPKSPASNCWLFQLCRSACLELQPISVYDDTEILLRNLIAYEQCILFVPHYVTSYAFLMDTLIDSKDDVELLQNQGVLQNYLGASEDASDLFNNLCKETILGEFYFSHQWEQLDKYCKLSWPKYLASFRSTHCSNPWVIISLIGAFLIFGLTAVQTAYSIKS